MARFRQDIAHIYVFLHCNHISILGKGTNRPTGQVILVAIAHRTVHFPWSNFTIQPILKEMKDPIGSKWVKSVGGLWRWYNTCNVEASEL